MRKLELIVLVSVCFLLTSGSLAGVIFDEISSGGVKANAWTWMEGEHFTSANGFYATWAINPPFPTGTSNSQWQGRNSIIVASDSSSGEATWTVTIPMAMDNSYLYARSTSSYSDDYRYNNIYNGTSSGTPIGGVLTKIQYSPLTQSGNLGAFMAGDTPITIKIAVYCDARIDGFFITNASIGTDSGTTVDGARGTEFVNLPQYTDVLPIIDMVPFTPSFSGAPADARYFVNGVEVAGFSEINTPGTYNLAVITNEGMPLAGVSFDYVPEPATMLLLTLGSVAGLLRRRK